MIEGRQIRAARDLLGLTQKELSKMAGVSQASVQRAEEAKADVPNIRARILGKIQAALENAGVLFIDPDGGGPGVRLKSGRVSTDPADTP